MTYTIRLPTLAPAVVVLTCLTILVAIGPNEAVAQIRITFGNARSYYNGYGAGYNSGYENAYGNYGASRFGYRSPQYTVYGRGPYGYRSVAPYGYSTSSGYGYSGGTYNSLYNRSLRLHGETYRSLYNPDASYYSPYGNWAY